LEKPNHSNTKSIRERAEVLRHTKTPVSTTSLSDVANSKLKYELEVHQIELEMQQEELKLLHEQTEAAREEYAELYDFAPTGYLALDKNGCIIKANLCAAKMLGMDRSALINSEFSIFISHKSKTTFGLFLLKIFSGDMQQTCELTVLANDAPPKYMQLNGISSSKGTRCLVTLLDITLMKQAAASLIIDKRRLATILIGTNAGTWEWNIKTGAAIFNERWAEILGYKLAELSPVSIETWKRFVHPEDFKLSEDLLQKHFSGETEYYVCEARMKHKNGHWVWVSDKGCVNEWSTDGEPLYMSGTHQDITQSKEQKQLLYEAERFSRDIVNALPFEICILDETGNIITVNTKWIEFEKLNTILPANVGVGVNYLAVCDATTGPDEVYATSIAAGIRSVIQLKQANFSLEYPCNCAMDERWFNVIVSRIEGEGPVRIVVAHENITERKQAAIAKQSALELLSKVADRVPGVIYQFKLRPDGTSCFPYASEAMKQIYRVSPQEVREDASKVFAVIHPDDYAGVNTSIQLSAQHLTVWQYDYRVQFADGSIRSLYGNAMPQLEADGSVLWHGSIIDVTERVKLLEKLQESEKRFKAMFEEHSAVMLLIEPETKFILDANQAAANFYGYSISALCKMRITEINTLSEVEVQNEQEQAINAKKNYFEFTHQLANGEYRIVEVHSTAIAYKEKKVLFSIIHDITLRRETEEKLRENKDILRSVLDNAPLGIWMQDKDGKMLFVNKNFCNNVGIPEEHFLKVPHYAELYPPEIASTCIQSDIEATISDNTCISHEKLPFTDGKIHDVEVYKTRVKDIQHGNPGLIGIMQDITERKQAEEKIRQLSKAVEQSPVSIVITNIDGAIEYVNPKFEIITGYSFEEAVGKNPRILKSGHTSKEDYKDMWATLSNGATWQGEFHNVKKNGDFYWESAKISPILNAEGITTHYLAIKEDITGRKMAEENLKNYASELVTSNQDLENFAYIASHDLQEPLRMITGFLSLLAKRLDGKLDKDNKQFIDFAVDGANRMRVLINDLLQYSRTGTNKEAFAAIDLNEVLAYNSILLKDTIEKNEATILVNPLPVIFANKTLINELFVNLLTNALKYRSQQNPIIEVGFSEEPGKFIFYIKDNGIGINKDYFDKIFVIFQRLHGKGEYSGTGIGLALCKKIVESHKGKIWVVSEEGKGSCFYFSIPKAKSKTRQ
jgi:PAS domain S-box-containing protein